MPTKKKPDVVYEKHINIFVKKTKKKNKIRSLRWRSIGELYVFDEKKVLEAQLALVA